MVWSNNWTTVEACDDHTNWGLTLSTVTGAAKGNDNLRQKQGTNCVYAEFGAPSGGADLWIADYGSASLGFNLADTTLCCWFYYVKGKGTVFLTDNIATTRIRCYINGTTDYVEYYQGGNSTLKFGWQTFVAGGDCYDYESTGTINLSNNVHKVCLVLEVNASNTGNDGARLYMDFWRTAGTCTYVGTDVGFDSLVSYDETAALGCIEQTGIFTKLRGSFSIGGASAGSFTEAGKFIQFDAKNRLQTVSPPSGQEFSDVAYDFEAANNGTLQFGTLENGKYAVDGCIITCPTGNYSTITLKNGSTFNLYASKLYRLGVCKLGEATTDTNTIDWNVVDVDTVELLQLYTRTLTWRNVEVHDNAQITYDYAGEVHYEPVLWQNVQVYRTAEAFRFLDTMTVDEYIAENNTTLDLAIKNNEAVTIINGRFSNQKIGYIA